MLGHASTRSRTTTTTRCGTVWGLGKFGTRQPCEAGQLLNAWAVQDAGLLLQDVQVRIANGSGVPPQTPLATHPPFVPAASVAASCIPLWLSVPPPPPPSPPAAIAMAPCHPLWWAPPVTPVLYITCRILLTKGTSDTLSFNRAVRTLIAGPLRPCPCRCAVLRQVSTTPLVPVCLLLQDTSNHHPRLCLCVVLQQHFNIPHPHLCLCVVLQQDFHDPTHAYACSLRCSMIPTAPPMPTPVRCPTAHTRSAPPMPLPVRCAATGL